MSRARFAVEQMTEQQLLEALAGQIARAHQHCQQGEPRSLVENQLMHAHHLARELLERRWQTRMDL